MGAGGSRGSGTVRVAGPGRSAGSAGAGSAGASSAGAVPPTQPRPVGVARLVLVHAPPATPNDAARERRRGREQLAEARDLDVATRADDADPVTIAERDAAEQHRGQGGRPGRFEHLLHPLRGESQARRGSSGRRAGRCRRGSAGTSRASIRRRTAPRGRRRRSLAGSGRLRRRRWRAARRSTARARPRRPGSSGRDSLSAAATPEISPPPPTPTTTTSTSGRSSRISSPIEPWPAITSGSSNGWTNVRPRSSRIRSISANVSPTWAPWRIDLGAVVEARLDLRSDGRRRHHDRDCDAGRPSCPRVGLAGVARRQGDDARAALLVGQRQDPVRQAAGLERACLLEVLRP